LLDGASSKIECVWQIILILVFVAEDTHGTRVRAYIQITPRNVRENTAASQVGITGRSRPRRRRRRRRGHRRGPHLVGRRRGQPRRPRPQGPPVPDLLPATVGRGVVAGPAAVVVSKRRVAGGGPDAREEQTGAAKEPTRKTTSKNQARTVRSMARAC
jgi:hypothetical protein